MSLREGIGILAELLTSLSNKNAKVSSKSYLNFCMMIFRSLKPENLSFYIGNLLNHQSIHLLTQKFPEF